jgi:DNA-binding transcriptional MerR regulator
MGAAGQGRDRDREGVVTRSPAKARRPVKPRTAKARSAKARSPSGTSTNGATKTEPDDLDLGSDKLYFKIGEVADIVGVPAYVLRYWESEFKSIRPQKSRTQQRVYRRRDVATLLRIKHLLYEQKFTIAGARAQLKDQTAESIGMAKPSSAYLVRQSLSRARLMLEELRVWVRSDDPTERTGADPSTFVARAGGVRAILEKSEEA